MQHTTTYIRARWLLPVDRPPIENGVIGVREGRVAGIEAQRVAADVDLGDVVVLPALVNAHTHLEFSHLPAPLGYPGISLGEWIKLVLEDRASQMSTRTGEPRESDHSQQLSQIAAEGCLAIGEIASSDSFERSSLPEQMRMTVFLERLGLDPAKVDATIADVRTGLQRSITDMRRRGMSLGISPHAPYSTHPRLIERLVELAVEFSLPTAMHLAETREEIDLIQGDGGGDLGALLDDLSLARPSEWGRHCRLIDYLRVLNRSKRSLIVHGNYLSAAELDYIAQNRGTFSVIYCPRTHMYFQHPPYPLAALLDRGIRVAIGTDSRASSPDLNLLEEARAAYRLHPGIEPASIVRMATLSGATALGCDQDLGRLAQGMAANFCVVPVDNPACRDPAEDILTSQTPGRLWSPAKSQIL